MTLLRNIGPQDLDDRPFMSAALEQARSGDRDRTAIHLELGEALLVAHDVPAGEITQRRVTDLTGRALATVDHAKPNAPSAVFDIGIGLLVKNESHGLPRNPERSNDRLVEIRPAPRSKSITACVPLGSALEAA